MARPKKTEKVEPKKAEVETVTAIVDCEADSQPEVAKSFPAPKPGKCELSDAIKSVIGALEEKLRGSDSLHLQVALKAARNALDAVSFENKKNQLSGK